MLIFCIFTRWVTNRTIYTLCVHTIYVRLGAVSPHCLPIRCSTNWSLQLTNGKCPDGVMLVPWRSGRLLVWTSFQKDIKPWQHGISSLKVKLIAALPKSSSTLTDFFSLHLSLFAFVEFVSTFSFLSVFVICCVGTEEASSSLSHVLSTFLIINFDVLSSPCALYMLQDEEFLLFQYNAQTRNTNDTNV